MNDPEPTCRKGYLTPPLTLTFCETGKLDDWDVVKKFISLNFGIDFYLEKYYDQSSEDREKLNIK